MSTRQELRDRMTADDVLIAPGVYDGISVRVVEQLGFDTCVISGAGVSNSRLGVPDFGILNLTENTDQARSIVNATELPVQADADTGYGNAVNVYDAVRKFEATGVAAVMIEDQRWPKRCGHMEGKSVISMEEMCGKVEAAVAARDETDPSLVIKARTDAAGTHGIDEAIRRMNAYVDRGADMVFADAIREEADVRRVCDAVDAPVTVNMGYGIRERPTTPLIPAKRLEEWGVAMISYPRLITGSAVKGMQQALKALSEATEADEVETSPELTVGFEEYVELMGLPEIQDLERRFARE